MERIPLPNLNVRSRRRRIWPLLSVFGLATHVSQYQKAEATQIVPAPYQLVSKPLPESYGIISWNIHGGKSANNSDNIHEIEQILAKQQFAMAGLQEVPASQVMPIVRSLRTYTAFFDPTYVPMLDPKRAQGNLILLNSSIGNDFDVTSQQLYHRRPKLFESLLPRSAMVVAVHSGPNKDVAFADTHLEALDSKTGERQARQVGALINQSMLLHDHVLLTCDINAEVGLSRTSELVAGPNLRAYRPHNPSFSSNMYIDGIFSDYRVTDVTSIATGSISDHKLVYATVHQIPNGDNVI